MKTLEDIIAALPPEQQEKIRGRSKELALEVLKNHPGILGTLTGDEIRKITAEPFGPAKQIGKHKDER